MQSSIQGERWSIQRRLWMLFLTVYFFFLICDFTSSDELFPHFVYVLLQPYTKFWDWIVPWTGKNILHLSYPITVKPNGSGDTTYNYVLQMLWIVFAFIISIIWVLLDRKRRSYNNLSFCLRTVMRYYFAFILFVYGFVKIIKLQFPFPDLTRLTETYGNSTPMGLAWTFIGYSKGYNIFLGSAEVLGGVLLFFKRTTLLGSLIALAVMINVAAMNFAYDIPVKLFSVNLALIAAYLASYDLKRLINFFFLNKEVPALKVVKPVTRKWKKILQVALKIIAIGFAFYATLWSSVSMQHKYGDTAPKPPLYGIYNVETFIKKRDTLPPLATDTIRWKQIIISYPGSIMIKSMADSIQWLALKPDTINKTLVFTSFMDSAKHFIMNYNKDRDQLILSGEAPGFSDENFATKDSVIIVMKRFDENKFRLVNRGYHWINEYPYSR